jgi:hypothetical protein
VQVRPFFVTLTRSASAVRYDRTKGYISVDYGNYESKSQAGKRCLDDSLVVYIESDAATKNRPEIPLKAGCACWALSKEPTRPFLVTVRRPSWLDVGRQRQFDSQ